MRLTGSLSGFPDSCGHVVALHNETADTFRAMAASIDRATHHVNALYFQTSWDEYSAPFYEALERAKARGVTVRLLVDHHGMRTIPGHRRFRRRLDDMGILWHQMLPFAPCADTFAAPTCATTASSWSSTGEKPTSAPTTWSPPTTTRPRSRKPASPTTTPA